MKKIFLLLIVALLVFAPSVWATNYCNDASIENCYPLDDSTDPPTDASSNARDLTKVGTPVYTAGESPYTTGGSWYFDAASSEYFYWAGDIANSYPFTMTAWQKGTVTNESPFSWSKTNSNLYYMAILGNSSDDSIAGFARASSYSFTTDGTDNLATSGSWYHVCYVATSATDRKIYINGVLDSSDTTSIGFFTSGSQAVAVGGIKRSSPSNFFTGYVTESMLLTRAFSQAECEEVYTYGLEGTKALPSAGSERRIW